MSSPEALTSTARVATDPSASSVHVKPYDDASDAAPTARQQVELSKEASNKGNDDNDDGVLEDLEEELDDDFDLGGFRERRMEELRAQIDEMQKMKQSDYGKYNEYMIEKDVIGATAKAKRSIVHFFHRDFRRCKIMDSHLEKLAGKHFDTLFIRVDVANAPFLVTKMDVKVLPCVIGFVGGVSKLKIVGFEELPGGDNFTTSALEFGLIQADVIKDPAKSTSASFGATTKGNSAGRGTERRGIRSSARGDEDADDSDLDY